MDFCVGFWFALLCAFVARGYCGNSKYYLETIEPAEQDGSGRRLDMILYECDVFEFGTGRYESKCRPVKSPQQNEIYADATFNSVKGLQQLTSGHTLYFKTKYQDDDRLEKVFALGVDQKFFSKKGIGFEQLCADEDAIQAEIHRNLLPFIEDVGEKNMPFLVNYLSVNNVGWFFGRKGAPVNVLNAFTEVLRKMLISSGYKIEMEQPTKALTPSKSGSFKSLSWLRKNKSLPNFLRYKDGGGGQSPQRTQSRRSTRTTSNPFSRQTSLPAFQKNPQLKYEIMKAIDYLVFKMIDPCFILTAGYKEKTLAERYCTTNCEFLAMANDVFKTSHPQRCKNLSQGLCENNVCVCQVPRSRWGLGVKNVNMVFCNNAFRLQSYKRAIDAESN